ncbi:hypothetical protein PGANDO_1719, partial [Porphyromonas gingivalis]
MGKHLNNFERLA